MSAPSVEEELLVTEFRQRVRDILITKEQQETSFLLRWLRARDLDLDKAEQMLKVALLWRQENNVDTILTTTPDPFFQQEFPWHLSGVDKVSNPIVILPLGKWDVRKIPSPAQIEGFKRYNVHNFETVLRVIQNLNEGRSDKSLYPITQYTVIADWQGFSYWQLCHLKTIQNLLYVANAYEAYYPETMSHLICINCPSFFGILLEILKRVLAPRTFEKMRVYGADPGEWEQGLREIIEEDQLSVILKELH